MPAVPHSDVFGGYRTVPCMAPPGAVVPGGLFGDLLLAHPEWAFLALMEAMQFK